jgi:hypothetical protein
MLRKSLVILILIVLLLPLFAEESGLFKAVSTASPAFQKPCDMDDCNPNMPKCPLCPSSRSINLYLHQETTAYLPTITSSIVLVCVDTLSDQGFVSSIFRPPTLLS